MVVYCIHRYVDEGCQAESASWEVEVEDISEDSVEIEVSVIQSQNLTLVS